MSRPKGSFRTPAYRLHRPSGRAVVTLDGRDHYLGPFDSPDSRARYDQLVGAWLQRGRTTSVEERKENPHSIDEVIAAFCTAVEPVRRKARRFNPTPLRMLSRMYGEKPAKEFGPVALKTVRNALVKAKAGRWDKSKAAHVEMNKTLSRATVNGYIQDIQRMFRWAAENELVPVLVHQAIAIVKPIERGAEGVRETPKVLSVPDQDVDDVLKHLSTPVAAMVQLQRITGARQGELCILRPCDIDMSRPVWMYRPSTHKTKYRGRDRVIPIDAEAQAILTPFLPTDLHGFCFRAQDALGEYYRRRLEDAAASRESLAVDRDRNLKWRRALGIKPLKINPRFTTQTYSLAILRGWRKLDQERLRSGTYRQSARFHPHQLRHNAATHLANKYGIEFARLVLGHARASTTEGYAEKDLDLMSSTLSRKVG